MHWAKKRELTPEEVKRLPQETDKLTETAIMFAGPIHRRDLQKHLRRMKKELRDYDRFQQAAREAV